MTTKIQRTGPSIEDRRATGALLATDIALALQLLQLGALDSSLTFALYCVAVSVPFLAMHYFMIEVSDRLRLHFFPWYTLAIPLAWLASIAAFGAALYHFIPFVAYLFGAAFVLAFLGYVHYRRSVEREAKLTQTNLK